MEEKGSVSCGDPAAEDRCWEESMIVEEAKLKLVGEDGERSRSFPLCSWRWLANPVGVGGERARSEVDCDKDMDETLVGETFSEVDGYVNDCAPSSYLCLRELASDPDESAEEDNERRCSDWAGDDQLSGGRDCRSEDW